MSGASENPARPNIFEFDDYREFLKIYLEYYKSHRDLSFRQLSKNLGFKSPNYIQKIVAGEREVSAESAAAIGNGVGLDGDERQFFELLVARANASSKAEAEIARLRKRAGTDVSHDQSIFSSWLYGVVWELASARGVDASFDGLCAALKAVASPEEIKGALEFLLGRGYLVQTAPNLYEQKNVVFKYKDDRKRNVDVQRSHAAFLKMALHRLNDDLGEREFQGLTIAVSKARMAQVKERLRTFIAGLAEELSDDPDADGIIRVQCAAFRVTR